MLKIRGFREVLELFLNDENIDACLPPYLRINMTIWLKKQIPDLT